MTKRSNEDKITAVLPQQQEVQRKMQQASVHTECTHSCPHAGEHASGVLGLTGDHCVTQLSSLCKQRMVNTRQDVDSTLPTSPGAEYATLQSHSRAFLCVLFVCCRADMIWNVCLYWNTFISKGKHSPPTSPCLPASPPSPTSPQKSPVWSSGGTLWWCQFQ